MRELGYSCTASADAFRALLSQFRNLDEQAVAGVLGLLAATHKGLEPDGLGLADTMRAILSSNSNSAAAATASSAANSGWNINVVMDAIKAAAPNISWPRVAESLDYDGFNLPDAAGFSILMTAWRRATSEPFPLTAIAGRLWSNTAGQLSLLQQAVAAPPDLLSWERSPKKIQPLEGLGQGKSPLGTPNQAWASLDLLAVLAQMADLQALSSSVLELLRRGPASQCPEVLVASTSLLRGPNDLAWGTLERYVWGSVAAPLLFESPAAASRRNVLLQRLWQQRRDALLQCMANYKMERPDRVLELLDVVLELKGLNYALDHGPPQLTVELACVASQRSPALVDLDSWLANVLGKDSNSGSVMQAALNFLESQLAGIAEGRLKVTGPATRAAPGQLLSVLSADSTAAFLRALYTAGASVVPGLANQLVRVLELAKRAFPGAEAALAAAAASPMSGSAADSGLAGGTGGGAFPESIELEANSYFQKLYHERQPVEELVQQLKAFKSGTPHQQVVFACMVHNLFDEYRFFPNYPDLELDTTAALFGALLHHQLLTNITLGMALRSVLQALAQPPNSKMFRFGLGAIRQFQPELSLWSKFCERALAIPHLKVADAALYAVLEKVVRAAGDSSSSGADTGDLAASGTAGGTAAGSNGGSIANGINAGGSSGGGSGTNAKGAEQQPQQQQQQQQPPPQQQQQPAGRGGGAAAAGGRGAGGRDNAQNGPQQQQQHGAAAGGKGGAGAKGSSIGSMDTADNLRDMMNNANVAQAAATMALNDKPERMTLNMTLNNETLDTAERKRSDTAAPNDTLTDKVSFLMNNLTADNMPQKGKELANVVLPKYVEWFANYLVVRRAAQEPNHHRTYVLLLDCLGHKDLSKVALKTTYYYCRALLESDRAITQTNERTLIKQLGMWLGLLTFAKNKPVLAKDMDLKLLIKDAYTRGRMIAVLPFVEKVLAGCKDSKVFKHTNPMIAGILSLMAEIHAMPRLKLNISFVIEMTFKTFEVSLADVCPSTVLRDLPRLQLHNPDFSALPEAPKAPSGAAPPALLVPPGAPPALTPPPALAAAAGAAGAAAAGGAAAASGAAAPPGTPPQSGAAAAAAAGAAEAGKGPAASPAGQPAMAGAAGAAASPAPASAASAEPGLLTKLHMYVQISPQLGPLAERLQLKRLVPVAVDRAMCDIITPVVERSVTIACMTTYELVTKDYATDPDESRLRQAAHLMVSSLAGSLALVTCKEPLRVSLSNQLRSMLQQLDPNTLEQAVQLLVTDNLDLGCTIIERAATDKAVRDIDKSLAAQYEARITARRNGVDFYKHSLMQQQSSGPFPAALPESLMPKPGNLTQQRVYEDFGRLPRGQPLPARGYGEGGVPPGSPLQAGMDGGAAAAGAAGPALPEAAKPLGPPLPEGQLHGAALIEGLMNWTTQVDALAATIAQRDANATWEAVSQEFAPALAQYRDMLGSSEDVTLYCAKRVIKRTWDMQYLNKVHAGLHAEALGLCVTALGGPESRSGARLVGEVTASWIQLNSEAKFSRDVADALIRKGLLMLPEVDAYVAKMLLQTRTQALGDFAVLLARTVRDGLAGYADVSMSLDLLGKLSAAAGTNEGILQLLSAARASSRQRAAARAGLPDLPGLKDKQDPPGFQQQVAQLFEDFARRAMASPEEKHHAAFVSQLRGSGLLNMDDATDRMLRILVELAVNHCLQSEAPVPRADGSQGPGPLSFLAVDPLVKLIVCLVTAHGGGEAFLNRSLSITVCLLRRDAEDKAGAFNGRPYLRLLLGLASELAPVEEAAAIAATAAGQEKPTQPRYLRCVGLALLMVQPAAVPGFAYGYLEMISHRVFMPRLLMAPAAAGWPLYEAMLVGLLHFLEPALRAAELAEPLRLLYKGTLRLLLVLLHDFPEFLCEHQFRLCEVIPTPAIQMRNLILSAFPRNMRLPDPFTPNLKVDLLPEISQPPRGIPPADKLLPRPVRALVDSMLASLATSAQQQRPAGQQPSPAAALPAGSMQQLIGMLQQQQPPENGGNGSQQQQQQRYHVPLLAGLVLYVAAASQPGAPVQPGSAALELLGRLIAELEPQGRYLLLNAVANQLRYPNAHTHYFSCVLLALFQGASRDNAGEDIRAQITRVLLERLIVNRPHPWGLLITFIELIKNPRYNFWSHNFTRCAPEIERLFESVARSCMGPNAAAVAAAAAGKVAGGEGGEDAVKA